jgi:hypothetical protein
MIAVAALVLLFAQERSDLPKAPDGVRVRQIATIGPGDLLPTRIAAHPRTGLLYVLCLDGDLWEIDPATNEKRRVAEGRSYLFIRGGKNYVQALGLHIDAKGQFYVVTNERFDKEVPVRAHVVIHRGPAPDKISDYVVFDHPWGIGPFNHGACRIATGPDGLIYLGVGSRTDHGEAGKDDKYDRNGETPVTACILRFDPKEEKPKTEVFARGLRNPFGFDWDDQGRLFAGENGPDADHPEELNWIRQGKHYGFPYRFGCDEHPMYTDAAPAPEGTVFERPVANLGPDQQVGGQVTHTFPPHAAPTGMIFYRSGGLPDRYKGCFFVTLFGNYLGKVKTGFVLVTMKITEHEGRVSAETRNFLDDLRRPIDLCQIGDKLYLLEHVRYDDQRLPRVLEIAGEK